METPCEKTYCLSEALYGALWKAAVAAAPGEACGMVTGKGRRFSVFWKARNVSKDENSFLMHPEDQLAAINGAQLRGHDLIAVFHSHPRGSAFPSERDLALLTYPGYLYIIASLEQREMHIYEASQGTLKRTGLVVKR